MNIFIWKIWNNLLIHLKIICLHWNNEISIEVFEETTRLERNLFEQILLEKCSKLPRINKISITKNINLRMRIFSRRDPSRALLPFILENKRQHFPSLRAIKTTPAKSYAPKSPAATLDIWQSGVFVLERGKSAGKTKNGKKKKEKKKRGHEYVACRGDVKDLRGITYSKCRADFWSGADRGMVFQRSPRYANRGRARGYICIRWKVWPGLNPRAGILPFRNRYTYVRVSSSDFPIENVHRFARKNSTMFQNISQRIDFWPQLISIHDSENRVFILRNVHKLCTLFFEDYVYVYIYVNYFITKYSKIFQLLSSTWINLW